MPTRKARTTEVATLPKKFGDVLDVAKEELKENKVEAAKALLRRRLLELERAEKAIIAMRKQLNDLLERDIEELPDDITDPDFDFTDYI